MGRQSTALSPHTRTVLGAVRPLALGTQYTPHSFTDTLTHSLTHSLTTHRSSHSLTLCSLTAHNAHLAARALLTKYVFNSVILRTEYLSKYFQFCEIHDKDTCQLTANWLAVS